MKWAATALRSGTNVGRIFAGTRGTRTGHRLRDYRPTNQIIPPLRSSRRQRRARIRTPALPTRIGQRAGLDALLDDSPGLRHTLPIMIGSIVWRRLDAAASMVA